MRLTCPACGAEFTLDVLIAHEGAREALAEAMGMDLALGKRLMQYLTLFRPPKRQLTMDRVATILKEIGPSIKAAQIERHGRVWAIPRDSWVWGLDEIVAKKDRLTLPLKSHGYLFEMLIAAADKVEAATEKSTEQRRASGAPPAGQAVVVRTTVKEPAKTLSTFVKSALPDHVREAAGIKKKTADEAASDQDQTPGGKS